MIKWLKERSAPEKWMLALIAMLLIGIALRWTFVKKEAGDAFHRRIEHFSPPEKGSDPAPDTVGIDAVITDPTE